MNLDGLLTHAILTVKLINIEGVLLLIDVYYSCRIQAHVEILNELMISYRLMTSHTLSVSDDVTDHNGLPLKYGKKLKIYISYTLHKIGYSFSIRLILS